MNENKLSFRNGFRPDPKQYDTFVKGIRYPDTKTAKVEKPKTVKELRKEVVENLIKFENFSTTKTHDLNSITYNGNEIAFNLGDIYTITVNAEIIPVILLKHITDEDGEDLQVFVSIKGLLTDTLEDAIFVTDFLITEELQSDDEISIDISEKYIKFQSTDLVLSEDSDITDDNAVLTVYHDNGTCYITEEILSYSN